MTVLLRRLRGMLGMGVFAGITWALVGLAIGTVVLIVDPASIDPGESPPWIAYYFGRAGFVSGVVAAVALALAERRNTVGTLRWPRIALWGALGGFALPWIAAGPRAMLPFFVVLGAATITGALALAKRGERLALSRETTPPELRAPAG
jgi:hypothetical protein